jgi:pyruvate carboxylase
LETGVNLFVGIEAIGDADEHGMRTVMMSLNGQLRPITVRDESIQVQVRSAERADPTVPGHVPAPFSGVATIRVAAGDVVEQGQQVAVIEAMKMEAAITAPVAGTVRRLAVAESARVDAGDLLLEIA